jgi:hypothetical protein
LTILTFDANIVSYALGMVLIANTFLVFTLAATEAKRDGRIGIRNEGWGYNACGFGACGLGACFIGFGGFSFDRTWRAGD